MIKFLKLILNGKHAGVPLRHSNAKQYALFCKKLSVVKSRISKLRLFFKIHLSLKWNRRRNISTNNSTMRRSPWLCNKRVFLLLDLVFAFEAFEGQMCFPDRTNVFVPPPYTNVWNILRLCRAMSSVCFDVSCLNWQMTSFQCLPSSVDGYSLNALYV